MLAGPSRRAEEQGGVPCTLVLSTEVRTMASPNFTSDSKWKTLHIPTVAGGGSGEQEVNVVLA